MDYRLAKSGGGSRPFVALEPFFEARKKFDVAGESIAFVNAVADKGESVLLP